MKRFWTSEDRQINRLRESIVQKRAILEAMARAGTISYYTAGELAKDEYKLSQLTGEGKCPLCGKAMLK